MSNIAKGSTWRRVCQQWLGGLGFATRFRSIGDAGDDITATRGTLVLSVEAKNVRRFELAAWVDQAEANAEPGQLAVVMAHRRGKAQPADGYVILTGRTFARLLGGVDKHCQ